MKMIRSLQFLLLHLVLFTSLSDPIFSATPSIEDRCATEFSKVTACLDFATGKATKPSTDCCTTVKDMKDKDPACLCYVIQQVHKGSPQLKSLGAQEAKLLQLPSACNLNNASLTDCPKLLNLPSSSPDYAFFTNTTKAASTAATVTPPATDGGSLGYAHKPYLSFAAITAIATTIFISVFPAGFPTMFLTGV